MINVRIKFILFLFLFVNLYSQTDTLYFTINMNCYNKVAKKELPERFEKDEIFFQYPFGRTNSIDNLKFLSIPVFWLNDKAKEYKCGDNLEYIINFKNDFNFQLVLLFNENNRKVAQIDIIYPENEIKRISDSLSIPVKWLPVLFLFKTGDDYVSGNLFEYVEENPNVFIFAINWLPGLWAVKNNRLIALTETCYIHFLGLCKISEYPASEYFTQHFSEEVIRDIAVEYGPRIGYQYESCKEVDGEDFKEITIIADIIK